MFPSYCRILEVTFYGYSRLGKSIYGQLCFLGGKKSMTTNLNHRQHEYKKSFGVTIQVQNLLHESNFFVASLAHLAAHMG